jgi:hypothetical protein
LVVGLFSLWWSDGFPVKLQISRVELIHFRVAYGYGSYELCLSRKVNRTPTFNLEHLLAEPRDHPSRACHVFAQLILGVNVQWVPLLGELEGFF